MQVVSGKDKKDCIYGLGSQNTSVSVSPLININPSGVNNTDSELHNKVAELSKDKEKDQEKLRRTNRKFNKLISDLKSCGVDFQGTSDTDEADTDEAEDNQS